MILGRTGREDVSPITMTALTFLLLELSPLVIFANDWAMISCLLYDSNALLNTLTIPGIYTEKDETMCHIQEDRNFR